MDTIRRAHFLQKLSVREIARRLNVSRKTVRKAIETEEPVFTYTRVAEPKPTLGDHARAHRHPELRERTMADVVEDEKAALMRTRRRRSTASTL